MKRGVFFATAGLVLLNIALLAYVLVRSPHKTSKTSSRIEPASVVPDSAGQPGVYSVTGIVKELRPDGSNIVISHEAVPGFMPAMTMPFTARDPREIVALKPGEKVSFQLLVTSDESWIHDVQRQGAPPPEAPVSYQQVRQVRDVQPLKIGDVVPDYVFTNQLGQPMKLTDLRGSAVGLTFFFSRCPMPEFCPRMSKNFASAVTALNRQAQGRTNWHLVSLTIDPAFDTPEVLQRYGEHYDSDPSQWSLLTGALIDIDALAEQVGLLYRRQTPTAIPDHNLRTVIVDTEGRVKKITVGNTWKTEELVNDLLACLNTPSDSAGSAPAQATGASGPPDTSK